MGAKAKTSDAPESGKKKKKHGCLKAFLITLIVGIVSIAALIGIGILTGDSIMKDNLGVGLFDAIGAVQDFGKYDEKTIVNNKYDAETDGAAFYDAFNGAMFFNNNTITSTKMNDIMKSATEGGGLDEVQDALLDMLSTENIDKAALEAYDGTTGDHISQIGSLTDKQLGAFIGEFVFSSGLLDGLNFGGVSLKDYLTFEQLLLRKGSNLTEAQKQTYSAVDNHVYLLMTCSLKVKELVNGMLPDLPGIAKWAINLIVPEKSYITLAVDVNDADRGISLELNELSTELCDLKPTKKNQAIFDKYADENGKVTKTERVFIVLESIAGVDLKSEIDNAAGEITQYICESEEGFSVGNMIATDTVTADGTFKVDMFGLFSKMLNGSTGGDATPNDVIVLLQTLVCTDSQAAVSAAKGAKVDSTNVDQYGQEFTDAVADAFGISADIDPTKSFDDLVKELLASGASEDDIIKYLTDGKQDSSSVEMGELEVTDGMLGAMVYNIMNGDGQDDISQGLAEYGLEFNALAIREEGGMSYADITVTLDISSLIGDNGSMLGNVLPDKVTVLITADITPGSTNEYAKVIGYNELSEESGSKLHGLTVENVLGSLYKVMPDIEGNINTIEEKFGSGVRSVINNLESSLPSDPSGQRLHFHFAPTESAA